MMKKVLITMAAVLILASCTGPKYVTSEPTYNNTVDEVVAAIEEQGYTFTAKKHNRRNERRHPVSHMEGDNTYSDWMPNDLINLDTYCFVDGNGNTMQLEVQYRLGVNHQCGAIYYSEVQTVGCSTSNPEHYESLCGDRSPIHLLDTIHKDMTVKP